MAANVHVGNVVVYDSAAWRAHEEEGGYPYSAIGSDFYVQQVIVDDDGTFDEPQYVIIVEQRDAWVPTGDQVGMWRALSETEVEHFKDSARLNFEQNVEVNPLWHPVVRDEMQRLAESVTS